VDHIRRSQNDIRGKCPKNKANAFFSCFFPSTRWELFTSPFLVLQNKGLSKLCFKLSSYAYGSKEQRLALKKQAFFISFANEAAFTTVCPPQAQQ
jgi:hypothetical protein